MPCSRSTPWFIEPSGAAGEEAGPDGPQGGSGSELDVYGLLEANLDPDVLDRSVESRNIVVSKSEVAGKTLADFEFGAAHQCWLTQLTGSGIPMPRRPDLELQIGDILLGAITGAMTSTAALQQVSGVARSSVPKLGYVGTYAFANALLAFGGGIIMRL